MSISAIMLAICLRKATGQGRSTPALNLLIKMIMFRYKLNAKLAKRGMKVFTHVISTAPSNFRHSNMEKTNQDNAEANASNGVITRRRHISAQLHSNILVSGTQACSKKDKYRNDNHITSRSIHTSVNT